MKRILLPLFLVACAARESAPLGTAEQRLVGEPGLSPNPLTFWWREGDGAQLRPALECALERIRSATCLPVDVSIDAHHWVRHKPAADMGGRLGWVTGDSWDATRIALKTPMGPQTSCRVLVHEIAQHVLQRRNDAGHVPPQFRMSQQLIENICAIHQCGCMVPESEDNPLESTQAPCLDPF